MELKGKIGRPTTYSSEIANEICCAIASTTKGTKRLCNDNLHWPSQDTIFTWLKNHSDFSEQYAQAKRYQVEVLVDEILEIADDSSQDCILSNDEKVVANPSNVNRSRLRIDTRKWIACKLAPRVYGSKVDNTVSPLSLIEQILKTADPSKI